MSVINASHFVTIDRHLTETESVFPDATGSFTGLMHDLNFAVRLIAKEVRRAGINDILGMTDNINVHGEQVRKIDKYANDVINRFMAHTGQFCVMASEESKGLIKIPKKFKRGKYVLLFDPLDGSTNIDVNITVGTIFSIYKRLDIAAKNDGSLKDVLQPGYKQVAAGYALYGTSTTFTFTTGNGVNVFTYDPTIGEFILTFENIRIPERGTKYYSCNEGNSWKWSSELQQYLHYLKRPWQKKPPYTSRYIATAVADIHRALHYGGVYMYPAEIKKPEGKIRLLYEANPLAMIVEQAGGMASTGTQRILDIEPKSIHQTIPFFIGSKSDVEDALAFMKNEHPAQKDIAKFFHAENQ